MPDKYKFIICSELGETTKLWVKANSIIMQVIGTWKIFGYFSQNIPNTGSLMGTEINLFQIFNLYCRFIVCLLVGCLIQQNGFYTFCK